MKDFEIEQTINGAHPPAPHFDDEATLVSARPVVPIAAAKANERSRIVRRALPFIIIAGFLGTVIGGGVGFYAKRRIDVTNKSPAPQASKENETRNPREIAAQTQSKQTEAQANVSANSSENRSPATENSDAFAPDSANTTSHFKRTRRQLAHTMATASTNRQGASTKRGAGRIQEIFAGPNPQ